MKLLSLFGNELDGGRLRQLGLLVAVSGLSSAAVLAIINAAAGGIGDGGATVYGLAVLVLAILLYVVSQRALMIQAAEVSQEAVHHLRTRLLALLRTVELEEMERISRNEIYACINTEMRVISDGTAALMIILQSAVLTAVTMAYLAWLSGFAFVLASAFIALAASFHLARNRHIIAQHQHLFRLNAGMIDGFGDLIEGFKEVKLHEPRAADLSGRVRARSARLADRSLQVQELFAANYVASQVTFFLLTGLMIFIVPVFGTVAPDTLVKLSATTLFLIGPITTVVGGLPTVQRLDGAAVVIDSLFRQLGDVGQRPPADGRALTAFARIDLDAVTFTYARETSPRAGDEAGFAIGPITFEIRAGQTIFITGGNGSGKSTLVKLITGLYRPSAGTLRLDGADLPAEGSRAYRSLFSTIFTDHHLFQRFYGLPPVDPEAAEAHLRRMELDGKVAITGQAFSTTAVSTGQRKRLAMIVTLMEDRPICVFDEWAADQDPHFRRKFYDEVLPYLKSIGKTVIAITHDDRYFDAADIRYHMEEGRLRREPPIAEPSPGGADREGRGP